MIIHTTALTVVHVMIVAWSKMTVAYAGHLSGMQQPDTNKRREGMMDSMTLASKEEVRKVIIELISIANLTTERDDVIIANARLTLQKLGV
jgi:PBP1b-binding outer membrane lipoprotein LpoB